MVGAQAKIPALNIFLKQVINFNFNGNAVGRALAEVGKKVRQVQVKERLIAQQTVHCVALL